VKLASRAVASENRHVPPVVEGARRILWIAFVLNAGLLAVELVAGLGFSSLALLADAAHQASDVVAIGVALVAQSMVLRPGSMRHTYGLLRAEALGAQINAVLLIGAAAWVFVEAVRRFDSPAAVDGAGVVVVAAVALLVNLTCAALLARVRTHDLNLRGAWLHMTTDAAGSIGALGAGVAVLAFDADRADPIASMLIGVLVVASGWRLLRDTTNVLLEAAPRGLDVAAVEAALVASPHVEAVHHLHVWELGTQLPALSVHVVLDGEPTLHDAQEQGSSLKVMLAERFGIEHATLELECHDCDTPEDAVHRGT
jgi:cobalt-zinc-cadmium efflux system protein